MYSSCEVLWLVLRNLPWEIMGGIRRCEKTFTNGDVYAGDFEGILPHAKGKYTWLDGTIYDGDWELGKMTGKGRIVWPSQATYEGEFSGGYLDGFGTLIGIDGSIYEGYWKMNSQHGIGRKQYSNSDVYDGCWREGVCEGCGTYEWSSGNRYVGNWKSGNISGKGVMKWFNGDLYDGYWSNGLRHGSGFYKFSDGSYYFGTWTKGVKDGHGTFYPAGNMLHTKTNLEEHKYNKENQLQLAWNLSTESEESEIPGVKQNLSDTISCETSRILSCSSRDPQTELANNRTVVYEREYMQGVLIKERFRNISKLSNKSKQRLKFSKVRSGLCASLFDGSSRNSLMLNLQLGIRYSVGKITPVPMREVRSCDFEKQARIKMYFPRKGSRLTPCHNSIDFYWKDYCPLVFRNLRELFKLNAADYMMSICAHGGLREVSSPGKSGSIFFLSPDDRFVIKTLTKYELKVLLKMLPRYYGHVQAHDNTLITKFFGVHKISLKHRTKVRFVVTGNIFCTELHIHRRYDLKGSSHGRFTSEDVIDGSTTLKDLDLKFEFHMDRLLHKSLFRQLSLDTEFLESQKIIDYSVLLGLHFRAPEHLKSLLKPPDTSIDGVNTQGELLIPPMDFLLVTHEPTSVSTTPGPHIRGNTLKAYVIGNKEADLLLPGTGRLRVQLGVNMPAQANRKHVQAEANSAEVELFEVYDVILYLGIIDMLQEYNLRKKIEHTFKSLRFDSLSISAVSPKVYSERLISFLHKIFPLNP